MRNIFNKKYILIIVIVIILAAILQIINRVPKPIIVSTTPENSSQDVILTTKIDVIFSNLVDKAITDISIKTNPSIPLDLVWLPNQLRIIPKSSLQLNTKYSVDVLYKNNKIYDFSFTTTPFSPDQLNTEGNQQTKNDLEFGNAYVEFAKKYPWYSNLPIETDQYKIVYDFQTGSFRIRILTAEANNQQNLVVKSALSNLRDVGVKDPINYYVLKFSP